MSSKCSLQSILFDFWPEGETPAMKSSSNVLSFVECYPYFLEPFIFLYPKKSEIMFQNQEVKLKYRIVVYQVREVRGKI